MAATGSYEILIKRRPFKALVCLVTLVTFLFNTVSLDLAWALEASSRLSINSDRADNPVSLKELNVDTFTLPEYLGQV